jgi:hypothetical protein
MFRKIQRLDSTHLALDLWLICRLNLAPGMGTGSGSISPNMHAQGLRTISSSPMDSSQPRNVVEFDIVWVPAIFLFFITAALFFGLGQCAIN